MQSIRRITRNVSRLSRRTTCLQRIELKNYCNTTENKNIFLSHFFNQIPENGDNHALIFDNHHVSYSELYQSSMKSALYLKEKYNIKQGDVISCVSKNIPQTQSLMIASHILNCVYFPINYTSPTPVIEQYATSVNSKLIICDNETLFPEKQNVIHISGDSNSNKIAWIGDEYMKNTNISNIESVINDIVNNENTYNDDDHALYFQTSGSTALPKIVVHGTKSSAGWIVHGLNPLFQSTALLTSQSYHASSYFQLMTSVINGGCIVYPSKIMRNTHSSTTDKVVEMLRLTDLYQINTITLIVTPVYELVKLNKGFGNSVNAIACGGDILPAGLMQKFMKLHIKNDYTMFINGYGSTEAGVIGMNKPLLCNQENVNDIDKIKNEYICINKSASVKHKIDEESNELLVKSDSVMLGYYNDPEKTAESFTTDGFFKTGDTVHVINECEQEETLQFMVVSRNKQVIVADGGRYIFPQYIENVLLSHKKVNGAVVIGVDCKLLFENVDNTEYKHPVAFITINCKLNENEKDELIEELSILCNKRNGNEIPYKIFIVDNIPKSSVGKVDRNALSEFANKYFNDGITKENKQKILRFVYQQKEQNISSQ